MQHLIFSNDDKTSEGSLDGATWPTTVGSAEKNGKTQSQTWSDEIKDLIGQLCNKDMGARLKGVEALKTHAWFKGFDWMALQNGTLEAPTKPDVNRLNCPDKSEIGDFDKVAEEETWGADDQAPFEGWEAKNPVLWAKEMAICIDKTYKGAGGGGGGGGGGCCMIM